jgi:hypothetical protein
MPTLRWLGHGIIGLEVYLLVLDGSPESLHEHIVPPCAPAVHAENFLCISVEEGAC